MGLFDLFSNDTAETAANQKNAGAMAGFDALNNTYTAGRDALTTNYGNANSLYTGLMGSTGAGATAYGDATGANGPDGYARAQTNFKTDPSYGFQMDEGLQALQRTHAASGNLASGNADADTLKFSQGLADQSYGNYVSRLAPYLGANSAAVTGAASNDAHLGNALAGNYTALGNAANATASGVGATNAAATMNNYNVGANELGAITAGGKLAAGLFGGFGGDPSSLFSSFGGGGANPIVNGATYLTGAAGNTPVPTFR